MSKAIITVRAETASLSVGTLQATDPFTEHGGERATIEYLLDLAVRNGMTSVEKIVEK